MLFCGTRGYGQYSRPRTGKGVESLLKLSREKDAFVIRTMSCVIIKEVLVLCCIVAVKDKEKTSMQGLQCREAEMLSTWLVSEPDYRPGMGVCLCFVEAVAVDAIYRNPN